MQESTRTVNGLILSDKNEPIPGVTINEIGKTNHTTISNINGGFSLTVKNKDIVYIQLSGMHFDRFLKYKLDETYKKVIFKYKGSKLDNRRSEKVYKEWLKTTSNR